MVDPETTKLVLSVSAALGVGAGVRGGLARLLGPSIDVLGDVLQTKTSRRFQENLVTVTTRAAEMVEASGSEPQEIPPRIAHALFDGASLEDDAELQERWAALIANAAIRGSSSGVRPAFAAILHRLQPVDAHVLIVLNQLTGPGAIPPGVAMTPDGIVGHLGADSGAGIGSIDLLVSLGLAYAHSEIPHAENRRASFGPQRLDLSGPGPWPRYAQITDLGIEFLVACTPPAPAAARRAQ